MGVDMRGIEQDPLMVQPQPQIRYPTSPSSPNQPTLMSGVTDTLLDKGTDKLMDAATDKALSKVEGTTVKAAGAAMGDPTGGVATELGYQHLLKPLLKDTISKMFFDRGGVVGGPLSAKHLRKAQEERFASADKNSMAQLAANEAATEDPSFLDRAVDFISGLMDKRKANNRLVNQGFFMRPSLMPEYYDNGGMVGGPLSPMMTNVSKVRYKQSGGKVAEEIELNYHGPLASKGG